LLIPITTSYSSDQVFAEYDAFADVFDFDVFICAVDGSKLLFAQIDGRKAQDAVGNAGEAPRVRSGGFHEVSQLPKP